MFQFKILLVLFPLFARINGNCQTNVKDSNNAVLIGNLNLNTVIIHVYNTKEDEFPSKEFIILTDLETGQKKAISANIQGKAITGGFIIVNGIKSKAEIEKLAAGELVYHEIIANDVEDFKAYETIINDYIKKNMMLIDQEIDSSPIDIKQNAETENKPKANSVSKTGTSSIGHSINTSVKTKSNSSKNKKTKINFKKISKRQSKHKPFHKNKKCYSF